MASVAELKKSVFDEINKVEKPRRFGKAAREIFEPREVPHVGSHLCILHLA
jgi:hypothetical protein